ncbi:Mn2+/Fe2+ transporter [Mycobacterium tuberculosis]|nr:Mn2+/Fe2+ transporter [Mycobacterium tuberculosis]
MTIYAGEKGTAQLLIFSQVILSLQLPFAIIPLVMFTASKAKMGEFVAPRWLTAMAVLIAGIVVTLNVKLLVDFVTG